MLWVKPGTFEMGQRQHTVTLTEGYWLGKHEVTQAQWQKVMGNNPSHFKGAGRPVEKVSWIEVTSFCDKLTALEREAGRLPAGKAYQLPTEAQWEYACRAGTKTAFSFGDGLMSRQANISGGPGETTDIGKYPANAWGFHDMHGNVGELCADWYGDYPTGAVSDPIGPAVGSGRVSRGGSWLNTANYARSANRHRNGSALSADILGFRLSLRPPASKAEPQVQVPEKASVAAFTIRDLGLDMLWVKPGTFDMGSPPAEAGRGKDETQHQVTLTKGFYLGKYEVTQAQWEKVMGSNPSRFKGADRPVEKVSWTEAVAFCTQLTTQEQNAGRLPAGWVYVLPTESQWEYACRAGTTTAYSWGATIASSNANYNWDGGANDGSDFKQTRDVGQYAANPWGFFDMHGNVWEWTADRYHAAYPTGNPVIDPTGPASGSNRVIRGGSWSNGGPSLRSAKRLSHAPSDRVNLGFRLSLRPASQ
jgi:formylglycine-generating enzyme required for sulfatase activity